MIIESHVSGPSKPKLLDQVRSFMRARRYSLRTEQAYLDWIRRFILFHGKKHPSDMAEEEITAFLTHLATQGGVAASTQNQALSELLFLYQQFFHRKLGRLDGALRASRRRRVPSVLTREEVRAVLAHVAQPYRLIADLIYGSGLRSLEALRLRAKDIDFGYGRIIVRDGKGLKDRVTMLPGRLRRPLREHLVHVKAMHERDVALGFGEVYLPDALERKYARAALSWAWQYVFPATKRSECDDITY